MATTTTNFGWDIPQSTDLVKDGATAIAALGQDIDTALVDLKGGTTGQVLAKASGTDLDFSWVAQDDSNAIQNAIVDAKGDLIGATAADTPARLAVGANGTILTADSAEATGLKWAAPAGGGKVLQVVQGSTSTNATISTTTYTDTNLTATITPTSATSKILVMTAQPMMTYRNFEVAGSQVRLMRGATEVFLQSNAVSPAAGGGSSSIQVSGVVTNTGYVYTLSVNNIIYLDSPTTTSATTYKTQAAVQTTSNTGRVQVQPNDSQSTIILMEIGA